MMNRFQPLAVVVAMILLAAWACTASASEGTDTPLAQVSKKKSCKKKSAKGAAALAGAQTARKKKCKGPARDPAKTPLSVKISSCPTGIISGSNVATISGTAAVGPHITTYITYLQLDPSGYFDTLIPQEVRLHPSASGAWSHSFTPGFQEHPYSESWEEHVVVSNYRAHDSVSAECSWTVVR